MARRRAAPGSAIVTWGEVTNFLIERERLRWTIRFLRVKLIVVQARHWRRRRAA